MQPTRRLSLFAKHWTPGKVKTRLAATVGNRRAADIYQHFVATLTQRLTNVGDRRTIWFSPSDAREPFFALAGDSWKIAPQTAGDLGERMQSMFSQELESDDAQVVLLGTDSPNVPLAYIQQAFDALARSRLVLGPTDDGGYYLIGVRGEVPPLFDKMPFSTPQLWQATLLRLESLGWKLGTDYVVLPSWYDVDTADDLAQLLRDLSEPSAPLDLPLRHLLSLLLPS